MQKQLEFKEPDLRLIKREAVVTRTLENHETRGKRQLKVEYPAKPRQCRVHFFSPPFAHYVG